MSEILAGVPIYHYKVECTMLVWQRDMEWCCIINRLLLHLCWVSCHPQSWERKRFSHFYNWSHPQHKNFCRSIKTPAFPPLHLRYSRYQDPVLFYFINGKFSWVYNLKLVSTNNQKLQYMMDMLKWSTLCVQSVELTYTLMHTLICSTLKCLEFFTSV